MRSHLVVTLLLAMLMPTPGAVALDHCVAIHEAIRVQTGTAVCIVVDGKNVSIAKGENSLAITGDGDANIALAMGINAIAAAGTGDHNVSMAAGTDSFSDAALGNHNVVFARNSSYVQVRGDNNRLQIIGTNAVFISGFGNAITIVGDGNGLGVVSDSNRIAIKGNNNIVEVDYSDRSRLTVLGSNNFVYFSGVADFKFLLRNSGQSLTYSGER